MTVLLWAALLVQVTAVALLRHRLGKEWLGRPVPLLVVTTAISVAVAPAVLMNPSAAAHDTTRRGISVGYVADAALLLSLVMLAFTIGYLATRPEQGRAVAEPWQAGQVAAVLDWRLAAVACLPLAVLTYAGKGYNGGGPVTGAGASLSENLAAAFFIVLTILASAGFLLRHGTRWFVPVLAVQSVLLAAAGERLPVVVAGIAVIIMLKYGGYRIPRQQAIAATVLVVVSILAITGERAVAGRDLFYTSSGLRDRVASLATSLPAGTSSGAGDLITQAAVRLNGADFAGAILQSEHFGQSPSSPVYVAASILEAVPSVLWPSKLAQGNALNPAGLEARTFGLANLNYIPSFPGLYAGMLSPFWLAAFMALLGLLAGWGERWLLREFSPARFVILAGAVTAALRCEAGLPRILVDLRAALVLAAAVKLLQGLQALRGRRHAVRMSRPVA
jgi:hypothetical protein